MKAFFCFKRHQSWQGLVSPEELVKGFIFHCPEGAVQKDGISWHYDGDIRYYRALDKPLDPTAIAMTGS